MIKYVFFDLDGTIIDSSEGIFNTWDYTLKTLGLELRDRDSLRKYIGPPLEDSFAKEFGFDEEKVKEAVAIYRKSYGEKGVYETELYDGIKKLIMELASNGFNVILATSKRQSFSEETLERYGLKEYFYFISGAMVDGTRGKKADVIKHVLENAKIDNMDECIMVGDTIYDVNGAKANNMKCIGVTYGFGLEEDLKEAGADYIAHNMEELKKILFSL